MNTSPSAQGAFVAMASRTRLRLGFNRAASVTHLGCGSRFRRSLSCLTVLFLLTAALGCQQPELEPNPLRGLPLVVSLECKGCEPGGLLDDCYGEALRDRLSNQARILPSSGPDAPEAARLSVKLEILDREDMLKWEADRAYEAAYNQSMADPISSGGGILNALLDSFGNKLASGVIATAYGRAARKKAEKIARNQEARLGYQPRYVMAWVTLQLEPGAEEQFLYETTAFDVVQAMRPMSGTEAREEDRLAKEEAFALARLVSEHLERRHAWRQGAVERKEAPEEPGEPPLAIPFIPFIPAKQPI